MSSPHIDPEESQRHALLKFDYAKRPLAGRVIFVAGGTGGLGAATAALLITEGAYPILGYRDNKGRAELVRQRLQDTYSGPVGLVQGDISDDAGAKTLSSRRSCGCATGSMASWSSRATPPARRPLTSNPRAFQEALDQNTVAPLLLARDVALAMRERGARGAIVLVSSMQGTYPFEGSLAYGTSKAALIHGARVLREGLRRPGGRQRERGGARASRPREWRACRSTPGKYDPMIDRGVITRFGRPEDIARAVRLLIDPESYITGQVLVVDGGLTLRRDM